MMKNVPAAEVEKVVAGITYGTGDGNETANAIKNAIDDPELKTEKIIPFSSDRKWSGVGFSDGHDYVFGAPQFIFKHIEKPVQAKITQNAKKGYRVLAVAQVDNLDPRDPLKDPKLIGLVLISDVIRPNAKNTFQYFRNQDVTIKVISGDDPTTVSTIAKHAGIQNAENNVDMTTVKDDDDFGKLAADNTVLAG